MNNNISTQKNSPSSFKIRRKRKQQDTFFTESVENDSTASSRASSASFSSKKRFLRNRQKFLDGRFRLTKKAELKQEMTIDDFLFLPTLRDVSERICQEELELQEKERLDEEKERALVIETEIDANRHKRRRENIAKATLVNERGLPTTMPSRMSQMIQHMKTQRNGALRVPPVGGAGVALAPPINMDALSAISEEDSATQESTPSQFSDHDTHRVDKEVELDGLDSSNLQDSLSFIDATVAESVNDFDDMEKIPLKSKQRIQSLNLLSNLPSHLKQEIAQQLMEQDEEEIINPAYTDLLNASSQLRKRYMKKLQKRKQAFSDPLQKKISKQIRQAMDERHPTKISKHRPIMLRPGAFGTEGVAPVLAAEHTENYRRSRAVRYGVSDVEQHHRRGIPPVRIPHGTTSVGQPFSRVDGGKNPTKSILKQYLDGEHPQNHLFRGNRGQSQRQSRQRPKLVLLQNNAHSVKRPHTVSMRERPAVNVNPKQFKELKYNDKDFKKVCSNVNSKVEAHYRVERRNKMANFGDFL